ncbi:hypothetical protein BLNAU_11756 [Blattamonas nauphoetae]|uniref:Uncharacterized protein n=1 Tax=Blattamonas nauphoetae TaxID=2049346 RepID=A0ABQ9XLK0_9EUKA|nr:hypothetical protein BLNAU_11756 [Blattamonas nauphoetae]
MNERVRLHGQSCPSDASLPTEPICFSSRLPSRPQMPCLRFHSWTAAEVTILQTEPTKNDRLSAEVPFGPRRFPMRAVFRVQPPHFPPHTRSERDNEERTHTRCPTGHASLFDPTFEADSSQPSLDHPLTESALLALQRRWQAIARRSGHE